MAQGDGSVFNQIKMGIMQKLYNFHTGGDTLKVSLGTGAIPNCDGSKTIADVVKFTGSGYADQTLANQAVTQVDASDRGKFDGDDIAFGALGPHATQVSYAVLWDDTVSDVLIATWVIDTNFPNGGTYGITWSSDGIMYIG